MPPTAATGAALALTSARRPSVPIGAPASCFRRRCVDGTDADVIDVARLAARTSSIVPQESPMSRSGSALRTAQRARIRRRRARDARRRNRTRSAARQSSFMMSSASRSRVSARKRVSALRHDSAFCPILHDANARVENRVRQFEQPRLFVENDVDAAQQLAAQLARYSRRRVRCHRTTFATTYAKKTTTMKTASAALWRASDIGTSNAKQRTRGHQERDDARKRKEHRQALGRLAQQKIAEAHQLVVAR